MRASAASGITSMVASTILMCGCSGDTPIPTGPVSTPDGGKAAFNEAKAIEKIYHAGYTNISLTQRDPDGVWRGQATRRGSGAPVAVSVSEDSLVVAR
jgi:hypothetical protein